MKLFLRRTASIALTLLFVLGCVALEDNAPIEDITPVEEAHEHDCMEHGGILIAQSVLFPLADSNEGILVRTDVLSPSVELFSANIEIEAAPGSCTGPHSFVEYDPIYSAKARNDSQHENIKTVNRLCVITTCRALSQTDYSLGMASHPFANVDAGHGSGTTHNYNKVCYTCGFSKSASYTCPGGGACISINSIPVELDTE